MPLLQVRNFPDDLHYLLKERAERDGRSVAQETTQLLREALERDGSVVHFHSKLEALDEAAQKSATFRQSAAIPTPVDAIREDRQR